MANLLTHRRSDPFTPLFGDWMDDFWNRGKVVDELKKQGVRDGVKVVVGGAALSERSAQNAAADAFAPDAITGLDTIKKWSAAR